MDKYLLDTAPNEARTPGFVEHVDELDVVNIDLILYLVPPSRLKIATQLRALNDIFCLNLIKPVITIN